MDAKFQKAIEIVNPPKRDGVAEEVAEEDKINVGQTDQLLFYGWYKVATEGKGPTGTRPGIFSMTARAKWDAWNDAWGSPTDETAKVEEAKRLYVEKLISILEGVEAPSEKIKGYIAQLK